jgi:hypothetical protein
VIDSRRISDGSSETTGALAEDGSGRGTELVISGGPLGNLHVCAFSQGKLERSACKSNLKRCPMDARKRNREKRVKVRGLESKVEELI